jgi:precorrin-8X/cobalt-precorrin-8 methylmutase
VQQWSGDDILAESFRIIEAEIKDHPFREHEWPVVRRMIHASGDLELIQAVHLQHDAVRAGVRALQEKTPIVTDVRMVAAGIHSQTLTTLGIALHCFIDDPTVQHLAKARGQTRSYWAMEKAITTVGEAVYVIGNAPTALFALCAGIRNGVVRPRLVVAMPVGFVSVVESKEEVMSLEIPLIAVQGRKGGSAMAAAAVNALLVMAMQEASS